MQEKKSMKKKTSSVVEELLQSADSAPYDPSLVMSELIKRCVIPRVSAALRCTDSTSYTSVQYASQLLGELLLFKDENSLPHITVSEHANDHIRHCYLCLRRSSIYLPIYRSICLASYIPVWSVNEFLLCVCRGCIIRSRW